jgi:hypothetical protein
MTERRLPWWMPAATIAAALVLRLLAATWRVDRSGLRDDAVGIVPDRPFILAFWHARMLPLVVAFAGRGAVVLVSQHRDGEWIAQVLRRLGYGLARGSSTRGGGEGARQMLQAAQQGRLLGITPDGPRGPRERVKSGVVYLASRSGAPVIPITTAANRAWILRSWDRFRVPQPFARVVLAYGRPVVVPAELTHERAEQARAEIEQALHELTRATSARAGEAPGPVEGAGEAVA